MTRQRFSFSVEETQTFSEQSNSRVCEQRAVYDPVGKVCSHD